MPFSQYAWAAGHNVALASLNNIENQLRPYNYQTSGGALFPVGIKSQPVDPFPVRFRLAAGYDQGAGRIDHALEMVLSTFAYKRALDLYLSSGTTVKAAMTFYLRRHDLNTFARFNGYLHLPSPQRGELVYGRQNVVRVTWPLTRLVAL